MGKGEEAGVSASRVTEAKTKLALSHGLLCRTRTKKAELRVTSVVGIGVVSVLPSFRAVVVLGVSMRWSMRGS